MAPYRCGRCGHSLSSLRFKQKSGDSGIIRTIATSFLNFITNHIKDLLWWIRDNIFPDSGKDILDDSIFILFDKYFLSDSHSIPRFYSLTV